MRSQPTLYLYKRNNGRFYIGQKFDNRVVWRSTGETTRSAALNHVKQLSLQLEAPTSDELFGVFAERFLSINQKTLTAKTVDIYRRTFRHFGKIALNKNISELTAEHWDRFKSNRLQTISPISVNIELRALRAALNVAVDWRILNSNPFSKRKFVPEPEMIPTFFSLADFATLRRAVDDRLYLDIIQFAALSGCRRDEITKLRFQDYDATRQTIIIQNSKVFKTKTKRNRVIPVHKLLLEMIDRRRRDSTSEFVFSESNKPLSGNNVSKRVRMYIRKAGLRRELHFHSLRHTFASWLIQAGESLYTVQKLLGHSSPRMTQRYSHLKSHNLHKSVEKICIGDVV